MINNYWYEGQLRSYILQFVSIFSGLQVQTGKGECGETEMISVPVVVGSKDRVVAAIAAGNTSNRVFSLPAMAVYLSSIAMAPERRKVQAYVDQRVTLPAGGVFPDDLTVVKRAMPVPYNCTMELTIYASNTQQLHQILEQILVLFNPDLQIQKSDGAFDWTKLTKVELTDINNEENYPTGPDRRTVAWSMTFDMPIYISVPMGVKNDLVRKVMIRIGDMNGMDVKEVDADGEFQPFGEVFSESETSGPKPPVGPVPPEPDPLP